MPRFLSTQPAAQLLPLPWSLPLAQWPASHLVVLPRGLSRHVVRFIRVGEDVYAAKEVNAELALHEYRLLQDLTRLGTPSVEAAGVVLERQQPDGTPLEPVLLTRHLEFALPYRSLFTSGVRRDTVLRLIDAMVVLIVRLHLIGFMWGDASLSNILFRRDAESFSAYLVDAETGELHEKLSEGQREHDLTIARTNIFGDFCDLQAGGLLDESLDPLQLVDTIAQRYRDLWDELTGVEEFPGSEPHRIEGRVRRLNALGFDVAELDIKTSPDGSRISIRPMVVDAGHHSRRLMRLTGLDIEEHQAQRLLNDLDTFRVHTDQQQVDEAVVAHQWLRECFEPVVGAIPQELRGKRDPAQLYHELLDYRWYQSERENRRVPTAEALQGYIRDVLSTLPDEEITDPTPDDLPARPGESFDPVDGSDDDWFDPTDDETPIVDPWEQAAADVDPASAQVLDIDALRAKFHG